MTAPLYDRLETEFNYHAQQNLRDEVLADDHTIREPWHHIVETLTALGPAELLERQRKAARILRDDGASYRIYHNEQADTTWQMDLLPWVIGSDEWSVVEAGLVERAELFNLVLADLYGERELITRGILPPEVVFAHKGFLRACQGIRLAGEHQLVLHSADLVRRTDGGMCVLADRTQAPSGAGYALENRTVMNRVFPSLFRDSHVHRLSVFFQAMRQKLMDLMPHVAAPNMVVLTPGAYNETYFEHLHLANYLGLSLVQSGDLLVRDNHVWMRSLDGITRVDVILRRVDDYYCDQVELKGDSRLGIPGLLEVARRGNVAIVNPLGSGVVESPALLPYLPAIGRHFLGREPMLDSVGTWWCGEVEQLDDVLGRLDELIVKPVFRQPGSSSVDVATLDEAGRAELVQRITSRPVAWVAQEKLMPSHLPVFNEQQLQPRPALLRSFAVAAGPSYRVMPGGLTRVGTQPGVSMISSQAGSVSKDTWVLASEPEKQLTLLAGADQAGELAGELLRLPSRVVENMFWLGRYAERAEMGLRLVRTVFLLLHGANPLPVGARQVLLDAVNRLTDHWPAPVGEGAVPQQGAEQQLLAVILDAARPGSIVSSLGALLACAEETRELVSSDTLRVINDIRDQSRQLGSNLQLTLASAPEAALNPLVSSLLSLSGIVHESMTRGTGWRFLDMGRRLERAIQTVSLVRSLLSDCLPEEEQAPVLEAMLLSMEVLNVYRRRNRARLDVRSVLELILLDEGNPRAIVYQVEHIHRHLLDMAPAQGGHHELAGELRHVYESLSHLRLANLAALAATDEAGSARPALAQLLSRLHHLLAETSNALSARYFEHAAGPQQLLRASREAE